MRLIPAVLASTSLVLVLSPSLGPELGAQAGAMGRVVGEGRPIPGARVVVLPAGPATETDRDGRFTVAGVSGPVALRVSAIGFRALDTTVTATPGRIHLVSLTPVAAALSPIVVTGTLREQTVAASPVKVEVISARFLERSVTTNLMEAISSVHGLSQQVDCAVCYTNSIRINGMDGPYTAVLIDGVPMMGALASVYGLNGIHPALIEQVEVVKGPASTLFGSEAMGGVVNVITKDVRFTPTLALDASRADHGQTSVDVAFSPSRGDLSALVSGHWFGNGRFVDDNGDGFSDVTLDRRVSLFAKVDLDREGEQLLGLTSKVYWEDRFGGVRGWRRDRDRGSSTVYGESIITKRLEVSGLVQPRLARRNLRLQGAMSLHRQDSWYGDTPYEGRQDVVFGQAIWDHHLGERTSLLTGVSLRHQLYDDNTSATPVAERRFVPGVFAEYAWEPSEAVSLLLGARMDRHGAHGLIPAPRAALKFQPGEATAFRINAGTGFRVVNLFTEDHAALTGARDVVIEEALRPERSWSLSANFNQVFAFGRNPMMVDLDAFHTQFTNRIVPDYDTDPALILYRNLSGSAVTRGVALAMNQNLSAIDLRYHAGLTWQDVTITRDGRREQQLFAPRLRAVFGGAYTLPRTGIELDWQGVWTGSMRLPAYDPPHTRATRSPSHAVHHLRAELPVGPRGRIYLAARNAFDYRQSSPLVAADDPFGPDFDTAWVYGPIEGRRFVAGMRWGLAR